MPLHRLFHNHLEQVAKVGNLTINLNAQLLLNRLLEFLAKYHLAVYQNKEIDNVFFLKHC